MSEHTAASDPILRIRGLTKRFAGQAAVAGIDLDVGEGEFIALLGPSGCGKSTTLMALAGFIAPDGGSIQLKGRDITRAAPEVREMGVVFQDYALFPHLSVIDNVAFPLRMRNVAPAERADRARQALVQVQLPANCLHLRPAQLSGGQRQRVAVARALVFDPALLLMDEPLAALDRRLRQHMQFELRHLQARLGTTVIYVTHDQEEALVLADRIVVMRRGRFEQVGSPRQVYDQPANAFVAGFLGESNNLPVRIVECRDGQAVVRHDGLPVGLQVPAGGLSGTDGLLVVRPECIALTGSDGAESSVGPALPARVADVAFLGDRLRVELAITRELTWTASLHPRQPGLRAELLRPGAQVRVNWRAEDGRLLART